jgi:Patatin phospholipase
MAHQHVIDTLGAHLALPTVRSIGMAPRLDNEGPTKDIDFSPSGVRMRWDAGYAHTAPVLESAPWEKEFDPIEGVILHESMPTDLAA